MRSLRYCLRDSFFAKHFNLITFEVRIKFVVTIYSNYNLISLLFNLPYLILIKRPCLFDLGRVGGFIKQISADRPVGRIGG
jgi:hypothetical protein